MANPRPAYAAADIVLGMGSSAARGLAFGKPLVVQGEAGWSELFDENTAAALARYSFWSADAVEHPVERLAGIIAPLLADDARRAQLGEFGRRFAVERFGLTMMAAKLAAFYGEALGSYGLRRWGGDLAPELAILARKTAGALPWRSRTSEDGVTA
jgi:glycosyltransferase involved in cell wall biosynthesis